MKDLLWGGILLASIVAELLSQSVVNVIGGVGLKSRVGHFIPVKDSMLLFAKPDPNINSNPGTNNNIGINTGNNTVNTKIGNKTRAGNVTSTNAVTLASVCRYIKTIEFNGLYLYLKHLLQQTL